MLFSVLRFHRPNENGNDNGLNVLAREYGNSEKRFRY